MTKRPPSPFDRVRPRASEARTPPEAAGDPQGTRSLFSGDPGRPAFGSVSVACSRCETTTVMGLRKAMVQSVPSLHLPIVRRRHPSLMRCPACHRLSWVRLSLRL
jgi:hypothetical protein